MRYFQRLMAVAMLLFVAGCAAPHTLSVSEVGSFGFGKVDIAIESGARLSWPSREEIFRRTRATAEPSSVVGNDLRTYLAEQVKRTIEGA